MLRPVEAKDQRVEKVRMHPSDYNMIRKNAPVYGPADAAAVSRLFGAELEVDRNCHPKHYEVMSVDGTVKTVVCTSRCGLVEEDCGDLMCLVEAVHDL